MTPELSVSSTHFHRNPRPSMVVRLLRFAIKLTVALALSGWLAVSWGHFQPVENTATALGLGWSGDAPCFKSLVPGRTRWMAHLAEIRSQLKTQADPYLFSLSASVPNAMSLSTSDDGNALGEMIVPLPADTNVTVSDMVQLYGVPCRVNVMFYTHWTSVTLRYPRLIVQISRVEYALNPNTPVERVTLTGPANSAGDPCAFRSSPASVAQVATIQRRWHGFTSLSTI